MIDSFLHLAKFRNDLFLNRDKANKLLVMMRRHHLGLNLLRVGLSQISQLIAECLQSQVEQAHSHENLDAQKSILVKASRFCFHDQKNHNVDHDKKRFQNWHQVLHVQETVPNHVYDQIDQEKRQDR